MKNRNDKGRGRRNGDGHDAGEDPVKQVASLAARLSDSIKKILDRSSALMLQGRYEEALNLLESMEAEMQKHPAVMGKIKEARAKVQAVSDYTGVDRSTVVRDPTDRLLQECESRDPEDPTMVRDPLRPRASVSVSDEPDLDGPTAVRDPGDVLIKKTEPAEPPKTNLPPLTIEKTAKVKPLDPPGPEAMRARPAPSRWKGQRQLVVAGSAAGLVAVVLLLIVVAGSPRSKRKKAKTRGAKSKAAAPVDRTSPPAREPGPDLAQTPEKQPAFAKGRKTSERPVRAARRPVRPAQKLDPSPLPQPPGPKHEWVRLKLTVRHTKARPVVTFRGKDYPGWNFESPLVEAGSKYEKVIVSAEGYRRIQLRVVVNRNITHKLELKPVPAARKTTRPPPAPTAPTRVAARPLPRKAIRWIKRARPARRKPRARRRARPRARKKARLFTLD